MKPVISTLSSCVTTVGNSKVLISAMSAIRCLCEDVESRALLRPHVGDLILSSVSRRSCPDTGSESLDFLWDVLSISRSVDLKRSIRDIVSIPGTLAFVYGFIIERTNEAEDSSFNAFRVMVGALEILDWQEDLSHGEVRVLQMFVSRATMQDRINGYYAAGGVRGRSRIANQGSEQCGDDEEEEL